MSQDTSVQLGTVEKIAKELQLAETPAAALPLLRKIAEACSLPLGDEQRHAVAKALVPSFGHKEWFYEKQTSTDAAKMAENKGDTPVIYQIAEQLERLGFVFASIAADVDMADENAANILRSTTQNSIGYLSFYDSNSGEDGYPITGKRLAGAIREQQEWHGDDLDVQISFRLCANLFGYRQPVDPYDALEAYLSLDGEIYGSFPGSVAININGESSVAETAEGNLVLRGCSMRSFFQFDMERESIQLRRLAEDISEFGCLDDELGTKHTHEVWLNYAVFDPKTNRFLDVDTELRPVVK